MLALGWPVTFHAHARAQNAARKRAPGAWYTCDRAAARGRAHVWAKGVRRARLAGVRQAGGLALGARRLRAPLAGCGLAGDGARRARARRSAGEQSALALA